MMIMPFFYMTFFSAAIADAQLNFPSVESRADARRLYEYAWHKSVVNVLQSPLKNQGYQYFGQAISADQNLVMVGAPGDNVIMFYGSVSIYETKNFELVEYLEPDNAEKGDMFGSAVAISGYDSLIGAHK